MRSGAWAFELRGRRRGGERKTEGARGGGRLGLVRGVLLITRRLDMKPARSCALHALRERRTQVRERLTQVQKSRAQVRERLTQVQKCRARVRGRLTRVQKCRTRARERHRVAQKSLSMARAAHRMAPKSLRVARERRQRDRGLPRIGVGTDLATNLDESGAYAVGARSGCASERLGRSHTQPPQSRRQPVARGGGQVVPPARLRVWVTRRL